MIIHNPGELAIMLRAHRKKTEISQRVVADTSGLRQSTISALENKPGASKVATLFQLLSVLGLEMEIRPKQVEARSDWTEEW